MSEDMSELKDINELISQIFQRDIHELDSRLYGVQAQRQREHDHSRHKIRKYHRCLDEMHSYFSAQLLESEDSLKQMSLRVKNLEHSFNHVSKTTVGIGNRLSWIDNERERISEAIEYLKLFKHLRNNARDTHHAIDSTPKLLSVLKDKEKLHEACDISSKLNEISEQLSPSPTTHEAVMEIQCMQQHIENDLLDGFSEAQNNAHSVDTERMNRIVGTFFRSIGKEKITDRYIWNVIQHRLARANYKSLTIDDSKEDLSHFYSKIKSLCRTQFPIISEVFPTRYAGTVQELLVERIFMDPAFGIHAHLEQLLGMAHEGGRDDKGESGNNSMSTANFTNLLSFSYNETLGLSDALLKDIENNSTQENTHHRTSSNSIENSAPFEGGGGGDVDESSWSESTDRCDFTDKHLSSEFMHRQVNSLFAGYREKYFQKEILNVQQQCSDALDRVQLGRFEKFVFPANDRRISRFSPSLPFSSLSSSSTRSNESREAKHTAARMCTTPNSDSDSHSDFSCSPLGDLGLGDVNVKTKKDGIADSNSNSKDCYETQMTDLLTVMVESNTVATLLEISSTSIRRCRTIYQETITGAELISNLFRVICSNIGETYLFEIWQCAKSLLKAIAVSPSVAFSFPPLIKETIFSIERLNDHVGQVLFPSIGAFPTQKTICREVLKRTVEKIEAEIDEDMDKVIREVIAHAMKLLAKHQQKHDFLVQDDLLSCNNSQACLKSLRFMNKFFRTLEKNLEKSVLESIILMAVSSFQEQYIAHILRFKFNTVGGFILMRDIAAFHDCFHSFKVAKVREIFESMRQLANIFVISAENLSALIQEEKLILLSKDTIRQSIKRREDYQSSSSVFQLP